MTFNLAERILQIRQIEAKVKEMEDAFEEKVKPYEDFAEAARQQVLEYLNATGQKSAATANGTAYWKAKNTYRVEDKDAFRRHVLGTEQYELITWAAAPLACEDFFQVNNEVTPPGLVRNSIRILYVNAPAKPRKRVGAPAQGQTIAQTMEEQQPQVETL